MKKAILVGLGSLGAGHPIINDNIVNKVRSAAMWIPEEPSSNVFAQMSEFEIRGLMGTIVEKKDRSKQVAPEFLQDSFPREFDSRQSFASCRHAIRDQKKCGSCWAFSTAETWADNACILGQVDNSTVFSVEELLACATFGSFQCGGGRINYAFDYVMSDGLVPEACFPYTSANGTVSTCPPEIGPDLRTCPAQGQKWTPTLCKGGLNDLWTTDLMKAGIMKLGSFATGFTVFEDFMNYKSGIYQHVTGKELGGHAIKVVGWGVQNATTTAPEVEYWIVANSWGPVWGEEGYFRFSLNDTDCNFGTGGGYSCGAKIAPPPVKAVKY